MIQRSSVTTDKDIWVKGHYRQGYIGQGSLQTRIYRSKVARDNDT